jgi:hypothetical protein
MKIVCLAALSCVVFVSPALADTTISFRADQSGIVTANVQTTIVGVPWHVEVAGEQTFKAGDASHHFEPSVVKISSDQTMPAGINSATWQSSTPLSPGTYYGRLWEDDTSSYLAFWADLCKTLLVCPTWNGTPILAWSSVVSFSVPPPALSIQPIQRNGPAVAGRAIGFTARASYTSGAVVPPARVRCDFTMARGALSHPGTFRDGVATCSFKIPSSKKAYKGTVTITLTDSYGTQTSR